MYTVKIIVIETVTTQEKKKCLLLAAIFYLYKNYDKYFKESVR
jgi:hypothetical protein